MNARFAMCCRMEAESGPASQGLDCAIRRASEVGLGENSHRDTKTESAGWAAESRCGHDHVPVEMSPMLENWIVVYGIWRRRGVFASPLRPPFVLDFLIHVRDCGRNNQLTDQTYQP